MILLTIKNNAGLVTVDVKIEGTPAWAYSYSEDQTHENSSAQAKQLHHTIGQPFEIIKTRHMWEFHLGNPSSNKITAKVTLVWKQGGIEINNWTETVEIDGNGGEISSDYALVHKV